MGKLLSGVIMLLLMASCGLFFRDNSPPRNQNNACVLLDKRPHFRRAFEKAERKWGVPVSVQMAIIHQESSFVADARPPRKFFLGFVPRGRISSAYGYAQALDGTWGDYKKGPGSRWARRDNIGDASDFIGWYTNNANRRLGLSKSNAREQYFAYHEGITGYSRGSHRTKKWLIAVGSKVDARANLYARQLRSC